MVSFFWAAAPAHALGLGNALDELDKAVATGPNNVGLPKSLPDTIATIVKAALSLVGTIFLVLTIYAGILWMTAQGEEDKIEKAQKIVKATIIGLFITLGAYAITSFVAVRLGGGGGGPAPTPNAGQLTDADCATQGGQCDYTANVKADCSGSQDYSGTAGACTNNGQTARVCCLIKDGSKRCTAMGGSCSANRCGDDNRVDLGVQCYIAPPEGQMGPPPAGNCCKAP